MDPEIKIALEAFRAALARQGRQLLVVHLVYSDGTTELLTLSNGTNGDVPPDRGSVPLRQQILEVLAQAERPMKGAAIARKLGRSYSGSFRETLRGLVEEGRVVEHAGHTYALAVPG